MDKLKFWQSEKFDRLGINEERSIEDSFSFYNLELLSLKKESNFPSREIDSRRKR